MKKILLSLATLAIASAAVADEVTVNVNDATDFAGTYTAEKPAEGTSQGEAAKYQPLESLKLGEFTFATDKAEGTTAPAYYYTLSTSSNTQNSLRVYKKNTLTVTAPSGVEMSSVTFTIKSTTKVTFTVDTGSMESVSGTSKVWSGAANSFTVTTADDNIQIQEVTIVYGSASQETLAPPVFTPASGTTFLSDLTVSIEGPAGATVYYTTDGTTPSTSSDVYSAPLAISTTTTVKAYAVKAGMNDSPVATAVYTREETVTDLEELIVNGLDDEETEFTYTGQATVTYVNGSNMYIRDSKGWLLVYGSLGRTYESGDIITGFKGTFKDYYGTWELMANASSFGDPVGTGDGSPETGIELSELIPDDQCRYITVKNVTLDATALTVTQDGTTLPIYNKFKIDVPTSDEAVDMTAVVAYYQNKGEDAPTLQLYPTAFQANVGIGAVQVQADAEYFNLQGIRVDNPVQGQVYIVRQGAKAFKAVK